MTNARRLLALASVSAVLAACDTRGDQGSGNVMVVSGRATETLAPPPPPSPVASPSGPAALPPRQPHSLADMHPRKAFVDPPLPPELRDDGGLIPLPPPPGNNR